MKILYYVVCETEPTNKPKGKRTEEIAAIETCDANAAYVFGEKMRSMISADTWKIPARVRVFASVIAEAEEFKLEELASIPDIIFVRGLPAKSLQGTQQPGTVPTDAE